jgi:hypothetical protein
VAYQVDVDKGHFQLLGKQDRFLSARRDYSNLSKQIARAIRDADPESLVPDTAGLHMASEIHYENEQKRFFKESRTESVLQLLNTKDSLEMDRTADNLLPYARIYAGIGLDDDTPDLKENTRAFVGLDFDIPFQRSKEKAALKVSRVDLEKRKLSTANIRTRLKTDFGILQERLEAQKAAIDLAEKRLALAQDILKAESKEYTYGRTDINDLIIALNTFQEARFTKISYEIGLDVLLVEWQRLTDRIVTKNDIKRARSVTGGHK